MVEEQASPEDASLAAAWRAGDVHAASLLIERHFDALYRFFRSKVAREADDLVQQTFTACIETRTSFRGECSFRTLLFQIARRRLHDYYRAKQRNRVLDFTSISARALGTSPSASLQRKDAVAMVRDALQELAIEKQLLLELCYWEDLSTEELAQVFEVPVGTIKSRLFAARASLEALLCARGYVLTEAHLRAAPSVSAPLPPSVR